MKFIMRCADEACNEQVDGVIVEVLRCIYLLNETVLHNNDTRTHCHSFGLVMRYVYECCAKSLVELGNLRSHRSTELSVEVGKRFVEKEYLRLTNDSTTERNTLSLTAGKSLRLSVEKMTVMSRIRAASSTLRLISSLGAFRSLRPNAMLSNTVM